MTTIYIPYDSWPIIYCYDEIPNVVVRAVDTDSMSTAGQKAEDAITPLSESQKTVLQSPPVMIFSPRIWPLTLLLLICPPWIQIHQTSLILTAAQILWRPREIFRN